MAIKLSNPTTEAAQEAAPVAVPATSEVQSIAQPVAPVVRRIYVVDELTGPDEITDWTSHLIRAQSQAQAISFLAKKRFSVTVASADQVATLMTAGSKVLDATTQD